MLGELVDEIAAQIQFHVLIARHLAAAIA